MTSLMEKRMFRAGLVGLEAVDLVVLAYTDVFGFVSSGTLYNH